MRCSGYTHKNEPCQNKVKTAGSRCHIHEGGITLLAWDLEFIRENKPFELRQGGRTYYVSIDKEFGELRSEVRSLDLRLDELSMELRRYRELTQSLEFKLNHSISYETIIRDVKNKAFLNLDVTDEITKNRNRYNIITYEYGMGLHQEIADGEETIKKLNSELKKLRRHTKPKPNDNYKIIKKENDDLRESVKTLKDRVAAHSAISKVCYNYEVFDEFINRTVEKITKYKRDYGAGIYNKITDFMRIRNINKICLDNLNISSSEFYEIFNNLRDNRNQTCHPRLKNRDSKNITSAVNHYLT